jgi:NADH dehydrogenase
MRILVLGASGFVGRHLVPRLIASGNTVVALARNPPHAAPGLEPIAADALADGVLERALSGCQAAVNLVGINHAHGEQTYERVHVELTRRLIAAASSQKLERLAQLSVMCARADQHSAYHDSKFRSDALVEQSSLPWVILRPAIIYGLDDGFTTRVRRQLALHFAPLPGGGVAPQSLVHVDDVASALERSLQVPGAVGKILSLGGARSLSYRHLVHELAEKDARFALTPWVPVWLVRIAAALTAWLKNPPVSKAQLLMLTEGMAADTRASWELLGITPRGFDVNALV